MSDESQVKYRIRDEFYDSVDELLSNAELAENVHTADIAVYTPKEKTLGDVIDWKAVPDAHQERFRAYLEELEMDKNSYSFGTDLVFTSVMRIQITETKKIYKWKHVSSRDPEEYEKDA